MRREVLVQGGSEQRNKAKRRFAGGLDPGQWEQDYVRKVQPGAAQRSGGSDDRWGRSLGNGCYDDAIPVRWSFR